MSEFILPRSFEIDGPWLIDENKLLELSDILNEILEKLKIQNKYEAEKFIIENNLDKNKDANFEKLVDDLIRDRYPYDQFRQDIIVKFKKSKKKVYNNINEFIKDFHIKDELVIGFEIIYTIGSNNLNIDISRANYCEKLIYNININDENIRKDFIYMLDKWISKSKPSIFMQFWKNYVGLHWAVIIFLFFIFAIPQKTIRDLYVEKLNVEVTELINKGIDENSIYNAVDFLVKLNSEYVPDDFVKSYSGSDYFTYIMLFLLIIGLVLSFPPKTNFGVGKGKTNIKIWNAWIKFIFIFIPSSIIIPIIINSIN